MVTVCIRSKSWCPETLLIVTGNVGYGPKEENKREHPNLKLVHVMK
jgi:hypothetical protein